MDTWHLVDARVFFTFLFYSFLFGLFFFLFGGLAKFFFAELPHCVNHSVRTEFFFFGPCVFFQIFSRGLGNCSLLKTFLFLPALPLF